MSEMSSKAEEIEIPKLHSSYYDSLEKIKTQDNFASWISFILFEEAKKMETLSLLQEEDDDDELSLMLKKRSTFINIATSADQKKNFTNKKKDYDENKFIVFDQKKYDRRRASSVINKISSPMPKEIIEWMKQFKTWNFDSFLLNELTGNNPLSFFMQYIYQAYTLDDKLDMDRIILLALELEEKCNSQKEDLFAIKILAVTLFF